MTHQTRQRWNPMKLQAQNVTYKQLTSKQALNKYKPALLYIKAYTRLEGMNSADKSGTIMLHSN